MTDDAAITQRVMDLIRDALQVDVPAPDTDLVDAGLIDSLALITLITELEREFAMQVSMDEFDLSRFRTAEQMAAVVAAQAPDARLA
jgi:D-alanine--poly(phosphoribitol) ligase subunit 2